MTESYGDLTLLDLSMDCMNLYELPLARKMMYYSSLSHMYRAEEVGLSKDKQSSMYKG